MSKSRIRLVSTNKILLRRLILDHNKHYIAFSQLSLAYQHSLHRRRSAYKVRQAGFFHGFYKSHRKSYHCLEVQKQKEIELNNPHLENLFRTQKPPLHPVYPSFLNNNYFVDLYALCSFSYVMFEGVLVMISSVEL